MFEPNNKTKLIYSIMFLLLLGLLSSAVLAYFHERSSLMKTAQEKQLIKANAAATRLTQWLKHNLDIVSNFAHTLSTDPGPMRDNPQHQFHLKQIVSAQHFNFLSYALDADGYFWSYDWAAPIGYDPRERPWYKSSKQSLKPFITWPYQDFTSNKHYVAITAPVIKNARFAGVVIGDVSVDFLQQSIQDIKLEMEGMVFLTNRSGRILVHQNLHKKAVFLDTVIDINPDEIVRLTTLTQDLVVDTENFILSASPIDQSDWILVFAISKEKIYSTVLGETATLLSSFLVIFIVILGLFYLYNRRVFSPMLDFLELDTTTGLANKNSFKQLIAREFLQTGKEGMLLIISIDEFNRHTATFPSAITRKLMQLIQGRIQEELNQSEPLGRFSENSFIAYLPNNEHEQEADRLQRIKKLAANLSHYYRVDRHELNCNFRLGACHFPHQGKHIDQLIDNAFSVIAVTKLGNNPSIGIYSPNISEQLSHELLVENALRNALRKSEFHLVYQPQYNLATNRFTSMEALIRWESSELRRWVSPSEFILVAEATDLIIEIGDYVIETAIRQLKTWKDGGYDFESISINISPKQLLQPDFLDKLMNCLEQHAVAPSLVELEVTETSVMDNPKQAITILNKIVSAGFTIAIDDFGTGFSSLEYLKSMPIHKLKVDRAFIKDLEHSTEDRAIVTMIMELSKALDILVLAEGVETKAQKQLLDEAGYQMIQGYYYSKPLSSEEVVESLFEPTLLPANAGVVEQH